MLTVDIVGSWFGLTSSSLPTMSINFPECFLKVYSSHYTDELSTHLLCASANPIYVEKHAFALDPYLERPQVVENGTVRPTNEPGTGLRFSREALARASV
jgi:hypothetical protein